MSQYADAESLKQSLLGKTTEYKDQYDASLLHPIPRKLNREQLSTQSPYPFFGTDTWYGYELSWLNSKGKPVVALARFDFHADSEFLIESKSFKLYLNTFNQTHFESREQVKQCLSNDLTAASGLPVDVHLFSPEEIEAFAPTALPGESLDEQDIAINQYTTNPSLLSEKPFFSEHPVKETLHSHLLKSNCLITSQPDWGSVVIDYEGQQIDRESLLKYLISFRQHNEFHEQCVERIFDDIWRICTPTSLSVYACYTRRGGLDITPFRTSKASFTVPRWRNNRQ